MYKIDKITKEKQKVTRTWKIISIIIYILIIPILIINFTLIIKSFINPNETPSILGYKNYIIVSGSMEPTIMTGDSIFVKEVPQNEIKINDIISFQDGNIITTHRIIKIEEENGIKKYTTKGDNNNIEDKEKIMGILESWNQDVISGGYRANNRSISDSNGIASIEVYFAKENKNTSKDRYDKEADEKTSINTDAEISEVTVYHGNENQFVGFMLTDIDKNLLAYLKEIGYGDELGI